MHNKYNYFYVILKIFFELIWDEDFYSGYFNYL